MTLFHLSRPIRVKGAGEIQTATISSSAVLSGEVDLGVPFEKALVITSDLTTDTGVAIKVAEKTSGTFVTLYDLQLETPGDIQVPKEKAVVVNIGGAQYLKIASATTQVGDRVFYLRGI